MLDQVGDWLLIVALSLLFNATPILAPPTMALLAFMSVNRDIAVIPAAIAGAVGATLGRLLLALLSRRFGARLIPQKRRADIDRATDLIREQRWLHLSALALYAVGPIPKSLLFMAAGMARMPLTPGAVVFCLSRMTIYIVTLTAVGQTSASLEGVVSSPLGGPLLIVAQLASIGGMILLFRVDVRRVYHCLRRRQRAATAGLGSSQ